MDQSLLETAEMCLKELYTSVQVLSADCDSVKAKQASHSTTLTEQRQPRQKCLRAKESLNKIRDIHAKLMAQYTDSKRREMRDN